MPTDLSIHQWSRTEDAPVGLRFVEMARAIFSSDAVDGSPLNLVVREGPYVDRHRLRADRTLSLDEIDHLVGRENAKEIRISVKGSMPCWRFGGDVPTLGRIGFTLTIWGEEDYTFSKRCPRLEGNGELWFGRAGPFVAPSGKGAQVRRATECVEENLERLTNLLVEVAAVRRVRALQVQDDSGDLIPLNAHLVHFKEPERVLDDLRFLEELWEGGLPEREIPPLSSAEALGGLFFHEGRSRTDRQALQERLGACVSRASGVTVEEVEAALSSNRFDVYRGPDGWMVLEYPHFVNAFVDRFYLELLEGRFAQ